MVEFSRLSPPPPSRSHYLRTLHSAFCYPHSTISDCSLKSGRHLLFRQIQLWAQSVWSQIISPWFHTADLANLLWYLFKHIIGGSPAPLKDLDELICLLTCNAQCKSDAPTGRLTHLKWEANVKQACLRQGLHPMPLCPGCPCRAQDGGIDFLHWQCMLKGLPNSRSKSGNTIMIWILIFFKFIFYFVFIGFLSLMKPLWGSIWSSPVVLKTSPGLLTLHRN